MIDDEHTQIVVRRKQAALQTASTTTTTTAADNNGVAASDFIQFHTDVPIKTLQVALNNQGSGQGEYAGGSLVFCTRSQCTADGDDGSGGAKLVSPPRPAGTATLHGNTVTHAVTAHTSGVRYGLFLLKMPPGHKAIGVPAAHEFFAKTPMVL